MAEAAMDALIEPGVLGRERPDIETSSEAYAQRFAGPVGAWFLRIQEAAVLRMLGARPITAVLEVGGGHGQLTGALLRCGYGVTVFGSDPSCQQRIQPLLDGRRCRFMAGDLLELPYADRSFDAVVSVRLLPHVRDWSRLIAELARIARDAVVVDYPTIRSLNCLTPWLFATKRQVEGNTRPYRLFHDQEVIGSFARHGFHLRGRVPQFLWPMVLHRMVKRPALSASLERISRATGLTQWLGSPVIAMFARDGRR
jgi:SAM-dependent methyltransferase